MKIISTGVLFVGWNFGIGDNMRNKIGNGLYGFKCMFDRVMCFSGYMVMFLIVTRMDVKIELIYELFLLSTIILIALFMFVPKKYTKDFE